jgi:hypothetical protein
MSGMVNCQIHLAMQQLNHAFVAAIVLKLALDQACQASRRDRFPPETPAGSRMWMDSVEISSSNQPFGSFPEIADDSHLLLLYSTLSLKIGSAQHRGVLLPDGNGFLCLSDFGANSIHRFL